MSPIQLRGPAPLVAGGPSILLISNDLLARRGHRLISSSCPILFQLASINGVHNMLRAVGHTPCRIRLAAPLGPDDLPAIVTVAQVLLLIRCLHLVAAPAHWSLSLRRALLLESVIEQLILI